MKRKMPAKNVVLKILVIMQFLKIAVYVIKITTVIACRNYWLLLILVH